MRSLSIRLLFSFLVLILVPSAFAHDVTLSGTSTFASLDGSSSDHDGTVNGVFTVNDGNLVVAGVVTCNDDSTESACSMAFNVSGNMTVGATGALYAENRTGSGSGGAISLTVGGNLVLTGNSIVSTSSKSSSGSTGGAITANVGGSLSIASGATVDAGSSNAAGGAISLAAGGLVTVDGNVLSGPSRTFLSTRLYGGAALDGGTSNSGGGAITISSSSYTEPAVAVGATASIVSQGSDSGAGPVTIDGCGITVRGLIAALSRKAGAASVRIRSGKDVLVDGRDLGGSGTRMGRVRADAPTGTALNKGVDVFAAETIDVHGPVGGSLFAISSVPGMHDTKSYGGVVRVVSLGAEVNASGNVVDDGHSAAGDSGGTIDIAAAGHLNLNTAVLRAVGDFNTNNANRGGGSIHLRSYSGDVIWTNGVGEVRPVGSTSNLPLVDQGSIMITACGTIDTTGSSFPVMGTATSVFPQTSTGSCSPAAPSLPAGVPPLITCNTPPVADDASASTLEDTTVTITLSATDPEGDPLTFSIVSGPSNGALGPIVPTGPNTATVNYTPNLNYNGLDSFVFQANDGNGGTDNGTVTITVVAVNDPPSFLAGPTVTVLEDSGSQSYANWATSISPGPANESGQTVTFTVTNDNNALFSVQPAVASNGTLTFTPAPNAHGTANITVVAQDNGGTANGGNDTSAAQSSSITVTPVNDEPSFTAGGNVTVGEDSGSYSAAWASGISAGPNEGSQTVSFSASNDNNALFSVQPSIDSAGVLTFTPASNANGSASVTVFAQDNGGTANGGDDASASATFTITVGAVNDAPSFTSGGDVTVLEDSAAYSAAWATGISAGPANESGQSVTFNVTGNSNPSLFATGPSLSSTGVLSFTLATNAFGSATITVTLSDDGGTANGGVDTSAAQTFTINVTGVNDEPSFTSGGNVTAGEDSGAYSGAWASAINAGPGEGSQTVSFSTSNDNNALFSAQPSINAAGVLTFTPAPNAFGSATVTVYAQDNGGTANGGDDTSASVTFTITVTPVNDAPSFTSGGNVTVLEDSAAYSAAWATGISAGPANESGQTVTFNITGNSNPSLFATGPSLSSTGVLSFTLATNAFGSATITVTLSDDGGTANGGVDTSAAQTFTINVTGVNDEPSFTSGGNVTVAEDSGAYSAAWASAINAGPGEGSQTVSFSASNNNNALFLVQPSISPAGVLSFTPAPNAYGSATVTVYAQDNGGTANGGDDTSASVTFTITVTPVNDPPTANNDSWETEGNTELRVDLVAGITPSVSDTTPSGKGVVDNDTDPEGDSITITGVVGCADVTAPYVCSVPGGTVTLNANGSFSFQPSAGATSGSFQYNVTDGSAASSGSVSIVIHDMIWYVNGSAAPGGTGTSASPFAGFGSINGIGGVGDADGAGAYIFVHNSSVSGSIALEGSQKLWGERVGLIIPRNLNGNGSPAVLVPAGSAPTVTAVFGNVVSIDNVSGTEVAGLTLATTTGDGIDIVSSGAGGASSTISSNSITAGSGKGIDVTAGGTGATSVNVTGTTILSWVNGVSFIANAGTVSFSYANGSVTSLTANGILFETRNSSTASSVSVTGTTFASIPGQAVLTQAADSSTITMATVSGNTFTNNGLAANFTQSHSANLTFKLLNNVNVTGSVSHVFNVFSSATSTGGTLTGRIQGNRIGNALVADSGSQFGNGIRVLIQGNTRGVVLIDDNVIRQTPFGRGIEVTGASVPGLDVTVTNNNVDPQDVSGFPLAAIFVTSDDLGSGGLVRADIRGNVVPAASNTWDYPDFDGTGTNLRFEELFGGTSQLVDTAPASATATAQLTDTNTGSASANAGVTLIAGPLLTPP